MSLEEFENMDFETAYLIMACLVAKDEHRKRKQKEAEERDNNNDD